MESQIKHKIHSSSFSVKSIIRILNSNSIDNNLKKGFVILKKSKKIIGKSDQLKKREDLQIKFIDRQINVKIERN